MPDWIMVYTPLIIALHRRAWAVVFADVPQHPLVSNHNHILISTYTVDEHIHAPPEKQEAQHYQK